MSESLIGLITDKLKRVRLLLAVEVTRPARRLLTRRLYRSPHSPSSTPSSRCPSAMSTDSQIPNGFVVSGTVPSTPITATSAPPASSAPPPEIEATLSRLSAYRNVRGVMILARAGGTGSGIIQSTGSVFEGENGRKYAGSLEAVVAATAGAVSAVDEGVGAQSTASADSVRTSSSS